MADLAPARDPALVDRATGELVPLADTLPALTFERATELLPVLEDAARRIDRLRGYVVSVIEADCAANGRTEVRVGGAVYTYRTGTGYAIADPAGLHDALHALADAGSDGLTPTEATAAIRLVEHEPTIAYHNGRLNDLAKLGGAVAAVISRYRDVTTIPAKLEKKR